MPNKMTKSQKRVLSFSVFDSRFIGHGGEKRTRQIEEIVSANDEYQLIKCPFKYNYVRPISLKSKIRRIHNLPEVLSSYSTNRQSLSLDYLLNESVKYYRQDKFLRAHELLIRNADTIVWENNFPDFFYLPYILKQRYKRKVIACPHNLESLISLQALNWNGKSRMHFLNQELEILRLCDQVFTISEEEQWLLNLFGIPAKHLPYYPLGELFDKLITIREKRHAGEKKEYFLIIGSASNPPTKIGMTSLLRYIARLDSASSGSLHFKVAGYGTEQLAKEFNATNIEILGFIEEQILNNLMQNCKAMIVNQQYSTGALTRIPEMLVAGIPVISNEGGARSYRRMDGVFVYNSLQHLGELLTSELPMPQIPTRPQNFFNTFMDAF